MKTKLVGALVLVAIGSCFPLGAVAQGCQLQNGPQGWHKYVDQARGFCFMYPPAYKRIPNGERTNLVAFQQMGTEGQLIISGGDDPFDLHEIMKTAPTGYDTPPEAMRFGKNTFYYYGAGGGGVSYPDQYFFDLRGKTLYIGFDGPYVNHKTPSDETKKLERKILATFSVF